jgi:DNA topoisomerase-6 subunit B
VRDDGKASWELPKIASTDRLDINFALTGLSKEDYDENEIYSSGINPVFIIGAEPIPGDWDVKGLQITEDAEVPVPEEEDEEVDYDESKEALNDD